jgi:hypothetical protein
LAQLVALRTALASMGVPGLVEASRRGGRLWLFLAAPLPATVARAGLLAALRAAWAAGTVAVPASLELYPSAANTAPGTLGQAVRLPLGVHRLTGRRYPLLDAEGVPCVFSSLEMAGRWVVELPRVPVTTRAAWSDQEVSVLPAPGQPLGAAPAGMASSWAPRAPVAGAALGTRSTVIRWVDAHVSPLDLLEELAPDTALQRTGQGYLGWCPFHPDRASQVDGSAGTPSFYVVHNRRYGWSWRCLSTTCVHAVGPMRHSFRLFQELLALDVRPAIQAALVRWPEAAAALAQARS